MRHSQVFPSAIAVLACLLLAGPAVRAGLAQSPKAPRPNIVVLLADDLGWNDIGYHDSVIRTPNLDRLAASGVKLDQFYVQWACTPTRAALMTGRYPMRHGFQVGVIWPWSRAGLPLEERTLSAALQEAGYKTAITGKWHLGKYKSEYLPTSRGFDHQYGHYLGLIDYFTHRWGGGLDWHRNGQPLREEGYSTDLIGDEAVRIIEEHDPAERPLFLYVPFNAPHTPLQAPQSYIDQYQHIEGEKRRTYAAMVTSMDDAIGRVVEALDESGIRQETLILFASDNGGPEHIAASNDPLREGKGSLYEGGVRVPAFAVWPGQLPAGRVVDEPLHIVDWYPTLLKLGGATLEQDLPLDGRNAWPTIREGKPSPHEELLVNVTESKGGIRRGPWKLVVHKRGTSSEQVELFNIERDPTETENLAERHPERVRKLKTRLKAYAAEAASPIVTPTPQRPEGFEMPDVWGPFESVSPSEKK